MLDRQERYAFGDAWMDPEKLFPIFMAELRGRYPDYGMVWDRKREQWLIFHRLGPYEAKAVAYCENGDGTPAEPNLSIIDYLTECEILRRFGTVAEYCDWLAREQERHDSEETEKIMEEMVYAAKPYRDYIERGAPETVVLRPFQPEHRRQVERDLGMGLAASMRRAS